MPFGIKMAIVSALLSGQLMAQQNTDLAQAMSLEVFTEYGKSAFSKVPSTAEFQIKQTQGLWTLVRFSSPIVPVWASRDFLLEEGRIATITADRLNLRLGSNMRSHILGSGERGYRSSVLQLDNGFAQILAPTSIVFALRSADVKRLEKAMEVQASHNIADTVGLNSTEFNDPAVESKASEPLLVVDQQLGQGQSESGGANLPLIEPEPEFLKSSRDSLHRLSPGDTISLRVFGEQDLSISNVRIPQSGTVSFPLIGSYSVIGKSIEELEDRLREVLAQGYVRNPRLSISIDSYRPIFVLGAAQSIGSFAYTEGLTIAKAIAVAGGAKNSAKKNGVSVLRDGQVVEDGLPINSPIAVRSGDIISIEEELGVDAEGGSYVYLHGEVRSPGEYKFRRGLTVEKAVVLAGGFTLRASRKRVSVSRIVEGEDAPRKLKKVELYMPIEPGDIIDVGASWF